MTSGSISRGSSGETGKDGGASQSEGGGRGKGTTNAPETIQTIKEITGTHRDDEVYAMLKECSMDPNETSQQLLLQDTFHEVKRKCDKKKEISSFSYSDDEDLEGTNVTDKDIIDPFSRVSSGEIDISKHVAPFTDEIFDSYQHWRSIASKIFVWYGTYGSNMWTPRFLCYIRGGQVEGMNFSCLGSKDKSFPKDVIWIDVPHRLFFGRSHTPQWGTGGVCFLHPQQNINDKAYMCLYKITLEQFEDVLLQENCIFEETTSPLLDYSTIKDTAESKSISPYSLIAHKDGWYSNALYLKKLDGIPILTMTCSFEDVKDYKTGKLPTNAPSITYKNTLVKGLVEGKQLSEGDALDYLNISHSQSLLA